MNAGYKIDSNLDLTGGTVEEQEAATAFAAMWNSLNPALFFPMLARDASIVCQFPDFTLSGREQVLWKISDDLREVVEGLPASRVFAELGHFGKRCCALLAQGEKDPPMTVVLFTMDRQLVRRIDYCSRTPHPFDVTRSGTYPDAFGRLRLAGLALPG